MGSRIAIAASLAVCAAGCASPRWTNEGATQADFERDRLECHSEAPLAEANFEMSLAARGHGGAVREMADDRAARAMLRANLIRLCLLARGYRQLDMNEIGAINEHVPAPPPMPGAPTLVN